jgi:hypothetical protein
MKNPQLIIFMFFWFLCSQSSATELILDASTPSSSVSQIVEILEGIDEKLILIGEAHNEIVIKRLIALSIAKARKEVKKLCYFVEEDPSHQQAFDLLPENPEGAAALDKVIFDKSAIYFEEAFGRPPSYWTDFFNLTAISQAGYSVIAVDLNQTEGWVLEVSTLFKKQLANQITRDERSRLDYLLLGIRNIEIAKNINNAFSSGACDFGILSIGSMHIHASVDNAKYPVVPLIELINIDHKSVNTSECKSRSVCQGTSWADFDINLIL